MPAAVLFDMDGTLTDSEKLWSIALDELAATHGKTLSAHTREAMVGTNMHVSMVMFHDDLGLPHEGMAASVVWLETRMAELLAVGAPWQPGAREFLLAVRAAGLPTALVTATARELTETLLDNTLGRENFDASVCGEEAGASKPDPAPYLRAAGLLGVDPRDCLAVEDSPTGLASAHAAGCRVLAVPSEVALVVPEGVHVIDSLIEADLDLVRALMV
ncbi:HAD family hydrolase [Actinorhabdospora filicis]|nr:HAD family phosphatase [Actinorhabdospora filicis]